LGEFGEQDCSTVTLGNSLDFILLLDGVGVGLSDTLGGGDDFVSEGLTHVLVGSESRLSGSLDHEVHGLVDSSEWRDIDSLSSDSTAGTDSGRVLSGSTLDDGLEENLEWVLSGEKVDDLKSLLENSDGHLLLTVCSSITNHQSVTESLGDWASDLTESLLLIFTSSVWVENLSSIFLDGKVGLKGLLGALDAFIIPLSEQFWGNDWCVFVLFDMKCYTTKIQGKSILKIAL